MSRPSLSAVVCAHNEEAQLEACLLRLRFADEIVVLLDRCTDRSEEIARRLADRVVTGDFPLEGPRRSAAAAATTGDWVLEIDADEEVPPALALEIRARIVGAGEEAYFRIPVDNYVGERLVRHGWGCAFGANSAARLFRRGSKTWGLEQVHPGFRFDGRRGKPLASAIIHRVDTDISDMLDRFKRYTALHAIDLRGRPDERLLSLAVRAAGRFFKCYVRRKGYREGEWGVLIALLAALYPLVSALRARLEPGKDVGAFAKDMAA